MSLRSTILGTACVVAVAAVSGPAFADMGGGFSGTLQGQYSNISAGSGGGNANEWGGQGSGAFGTGWGGLKLQVDGGYQGVTVSGNGSIDDWNVDGAAFWQSGWGRLGGTVGYNGISGSGSNINITNYGGFAEWYAAPMFTVGVKGGGASANDGGFGRYRLLQRRPWRQHHELWRNGGVAGFGARAGLCVWRLYLFRLFGR